MYKKQRTLTNYEVGQHQEWVSVKSVNKLNNRELYIKESLAELKEKQAIQNL